MQQRGYASYNLRPTALKNSFLAPMVPGKRTLWTQIKESVDTIRLQARILCKILAILTHKNILFLVEMMLGGSVILAYC
jgi:hypothetical protein